MPVIVRFILLSSVSTLAFWLPAAARAQTPDAAPAPAKLRSGGIEQVVVTARRRSETVEKTPVSITVFGAANLRNKVVRNATDLQQTTPSLQILTNASSPQGLQVSMRGQVQTSADANAPGSVGVYIDDIYYGGATVAGSLLDLNDLQRVEVLKGPQGTLYGRNVTGGLIKFVTNKPKEDTYEGYLTLGLGNYDRHYAETMVNAPIVKDKLAFRIVADWDEHSGYSHDIVNDRDLDDQHKGSVRAEVKFDPNADLDILLQGWMGTGRDNGVDSRTIYVQPGVSVGALNIEAAEHINGITPAALAPLVFGAAGGFTPAQIGAAYATALAGLPRVNALVQQQLNAPRNQVLGSPLLDTFDKAQSRGGAATITYDLGFATLKSITGYTFDRRESLVNVGGGPWFAVIDDQPQSYVAQLTQELQLTGRAINNRVQYAAGIYLLRSNLEDDRQTLGGGFYQFLGQEGLGITNSNPGTNKFVDKNAAIYGQATYSILPTVHLTGGLRGTTEAVRNTSDTILLPQASTGFLTVCGGPAPDTAATPISQCAKSQAISNNALSYTLSLDWQVTPDILAYFRTSRGFKSGGVNNYPPNYQPLLTYQPEIATDYEIGAKSQWLDHRLQINADIYHTDYKQIQRIVTTAIGLGITTTGTQNAAAATIDGAEFDATAILYPGLTLSGTAAYTYPKYQSYTQVNFGYPGGVENLTGEPFEGVSRWTTSTSLAYAFDTRYAHIHTELDWIYLSKADLWPNDQYPSTLGGPDFTPASYTYQGGYSLLNASFVADFTQWHSTLTLYGKNMLDKRYKSSATGLLNNGLGLAYANYGPPATFGVDYTYHF